MTSSTNALGRSGLFAMVAAGALGCLTAAGCAGDDSHPPADDETCADATTCHPALVAATGGTNGGAVAIGASGTNGGDNGGDAGTIGTNTSTNGAPLGPDASTASSLGAGSTGP